MPKGYENKDKNNEVYKPEGKMPKGYTSHGIGNTTNSKNSYSNTPTKSKHTNTIAGFIVFIVFIVIVAGVYWYLLASADEETEKMLAQGCTIVGTDWRRVATNFLCPPGVG